MLSMGSFGAELPGHPVIVERIWIGNSWRNYNYLIVGPESGEALAIDPLDHRKCLAAARRACTSSRPAQAPVSCTPQCPKQIP